MRKKAKGTGRKARKAAPRRPKTTARRKAARKSSRKTRAKAKTVAHPAIPLPPPRPKIIKFMDLEAAPRCRSRIPVEIDVHGRRERGAIADMSASGARIVGVQLDLPAGTPLQIRYASGTAPILLAAEVVRRTADGFAVKILPASGLGQRR
ncbi:MAG TPA: PilZ domain-containing protein [Myxococcota bacterium]|nr:PilZ domain-containing protein [Myxococcota bacterium]